MKELYVKIDQQIYLDIINGRIATSARHSIPITTQISTRKVKPMLKYVQKVGNVWIGSNKLSFALIMSYIMLKEQKNRVIGFYKHENRYLYIECSMDMYSRISIKVDFTAENETPEMYISISGKVYDSIFGDKEFRNTDFSFAGAYKVFARKVSPAQLIAIVIIVSVTGYIAYQGFFKKPPPIKIETPKVFHKKPPPPPPLSHDEKKHLMLQLTKYTISTFGTIQSSIQQSPEKKLRGFNAKIAPPNDMEVKMDIDAVYESFYPFAGSKKQIKEYIWNESYSKSLKREDIVIYSPVDYKTCLKYMLGYEIKERTHDNWKIILKEKDFRKINFLMNMVYNCPVTIQEMHLGTDGLDATVLVWN